MKADLRQLQALVTIARHGTLNRAADALHCSPSALSMQLTALQQRLGVTLLRRTGRGLELTAEGERLLPAARDAVAAAERFVDLAVAPTATDTTTPALAPVPVMLGTILDPAAIRLGEFLRSVRERGPHIHPVLRHGVSGSVLAEVQAGTLDLGFTLGEPPADGLRLLRLASVRYVVVAPRGWQARLTGCDWPELLALPWVDTPPTSVHHRLLAPLRAACAAPAHTVARVDQEVSMIDLVRAGFGLSLAREAVALREADQSGLVVSRAHRLDTALWLAARDVASDADVQRTVDTLFDAATGIWRPGAA